MNYRLVRFLDYNIGMLISIILGAIKRKKKKVKSDVRKILLIRFWGLGSIVMSTPFVRAIKESFPDAELVLLTMSKNIGLYDDSALFSRIIYYDMKTISKTIKNTTGLISKLRRERFDIAIDMEFFSRYSAIVAYFSGATTKIGFNTKGQGRERLYDISAKFFEDENRIITFSRLARVFGIDVTEHELEPLHFNEKDKKKVDNILKKSSIVEGTLNIVINPNAGDFADERMWPAERFAQVADMIVKELKAGIIFTGGPSDATRVAHITGLMSRYSLNLAGKINLRQLAYLLSKADVFLTNDSGPMHIGFAMKTPTVALFGPESPKRYGPLDTSNNRVLYKKTRCSPCIKIQNQNLIRCRFNQRCMQNIAVDDVFSAVKSLLKK